MSIIDRRTILGMGAIASIPVLSCNGDKPNAADPTQSKAAKAESERRDAQLLNDGILLEQGAINIYKAAAGLPFIKADPAVLGVAGLFMSQHEEHRDTLIKWVEQLGGKPSDPNDANTPVIPKVILDENATPDARKLATLQFARKLEKQAADAYFQLVVQGLETDFARRSAAQILPVEAQHVAVYDTVLKAAAPVNAALFGEQS